MKFILNEIQHMNEFNEQMKTFIKAFKTAFISEFNWSTSIFLIYLFFSPYYKVF